jgi:hypothetical protein
MRRIWNPLAIALLSSCAGVQRPPNPEMPPPNPEMPPVGYLPPNLKKWGVVVDDLDANEARRRIRMLERVLDPKVRRALYMGPKDYGLTWTRAFAGRQNREPHEPDYLLGIALLYLNLERVEQQPTQRYAAASTADKVLTNLRTLVLLQHRSYPRAAEAAFFHSDLGWRLGRRREDTGWWIDPSDIGGEFQKRVELIGAMRDCAAGRAKDANRSYRSLRQGKGTVANLALQQPDCGISSAQ